MPALCCRDIRTQQPSSQPADAAARGIVMQPVRSRIASQHIDADRTCMFRQWSPTEPDAGPPPHQTGSRGWAASCSSRAGLQAVHGTSADWRHARHAQRCCPGPQVSKEPGRAAGDLCKVYGQLAQLGVLWSMQVGGIMLHPDSKMMAPALCPACWLLISIVG